VIDLHCHIDLYPDPGRIIAECARQGVYVLAVTTTPLAWEGNLKLTRGKPRIQVALGLHPELVPERHAELPLLLSLIPRSRYVGEVGIDGSPHMKKHVPLQTDIFHQVVAKCADLSGRVISIHSRAAATNVLDILEQHPSAGVPILHWFSGTLAELDRAIALGCWFSVGPGMLRSKKGRLLAARMPRDRVLTETDAPFVQDRGRPLMPWDVETAELALAECWDRSAPDISELLLRNFRTLSIAAQRFQELE
jgi:TatD DNase family protein